MIYQKRLLTETFHLFFKISCKTRETVASMIEELKRKYLVEQVIVAECLACEKSSDCYSISDKTNIEQTFILVSTKSIYLFLSTMHNWRRKPITLVIIVLLMQGKLHRLL